MTRVSDARAYPPNVVRTFKMDGGGSRVNPLPPTRVISIIFSRYQEGADHRAPRWFGIVTSRNLGQPLVNQVAATYKIGPFAARYLNLGQARGLVSEFRAVKIRPEVFGRRCRTVGVIEPVPDLPLFLYTSLNLNLKDGLKEGVVSPAVEK